MTDLLNRLTEARPTDTELDAMWSPHDRDARLHAVLATHLARRVRRTRMALAAAVVAIVAFVPPLLNSGNASAADLHALAQSAVRYHGPVLSEGAWLHVKATSLQRNAPTVHGAAVYANELESWTSWDGRELLIDHETSAGWTEYEMIDDHVAASYQDPTPEFSATLPDTAQGLLDYLNPRVYGSSSHSEALYEALIQLAGSHTLPPRTLAAAFEALAHIDNVATDRVDVNGRAGIEVSYDEALTSSTDTVVFDLATGQALSTHNHSRQSDFVSTTTLSEVVTAVPAAERAAFRAHKHNVR
jgi:hypothetical protein